MKYYLGIDGGGTKTTAVVSDEKGNILLKSTGKTINFYSVGMSAAKENLRFVIDEIYSSLGQIEFDGAFIGCSALDNEAEECVINDLCGGIINAKKIGMNSDAFVALNACDGELPCVAICGTGSMAIGKTENGEIKVKGGWGHIIGDEGSAYSIAANALRGCCIITDMNKSYPLTEEAKKFFGVDDFRKAINVIYSENTTKDVLASFAQVVGALADNDDFVSKTVIQNEAHGFSKTVLTLLLEMKKCTGLYLYGGVFENSKFFNKVFTEDIKEVYPDLKIEFLKLSAAEGAVKVARKL